MSAGTTGQVFRCFVAVPLPTEAKESWQVREPAKPAFPGYRFGAPKTCTSPSSLGDWNWLRSLP